MKQSINKTIIRSAKDTQKGFMECEDMLIKLTGMYNDVCNENLILRGLCRDFTCLVRYPTLASKTKGQICIEMEAIIFPKNETSQ